MDDPISSSSPFSPEQIKRRKLDGEQISSPLGETIQGTEEEGDDAQSVNTSTIVPTTKIQAMIKGQNQNMDSSNTDNHNKTRNSLVEIEDDEDEDEMMVMDDIGDEEESVFNNNNSIHHHHLQQQHDSSKRFIQPDGTAQTLDDLMKSISSERVTRKDFMSSAVIDPITNRIQLVTVSNNSKMNPKSSYGYDVERKTYLCPEEALYLMETGKLEICIENIPISIMKARALFISEKLGLSQQLPSPSEFDAVTCTDEEYIVFKLLSAHGYRVRRCFIPPSHSSSLNQAKGQVVDVIELEQEDDDDDDVEMKSGSGTEFEDNVGISTTTTTEGTKSDEKIQDFHSLFSRNQLKRKILGSKASPSSLISDDNNDDDVQPETIDWEVPSSTIGKTIGGAKKVNIIPEEEKMIDDDDDDGNRIYVELEVPGPSSSSTSTRIFNVRAADDSSYSSIEDEPMPSTSKGSRENEEPYTVVEVDSDVEFIDEVIFSSSQVEIEEVGSYKYEGDDLTTDLPDIEEDDEEESDGDGEGYYEEEDEEIDYDNEGNIIKPSSTSTCTDYYKNKNSRGGGGVQLVVDLVSSDEELEEEGNRTQIITEDVAIKNFAETIWSKFVPNSVVHLEFPPATLLPKEIQRNVDSSKVQINTKGTTVSSSNISLGGESQENQIPITYEFDMKDQGDQSDLELEKIVDELKIDSEPMDSSSEPTTSNDTVNHTSRNRINSKSAVKNWKEWRQQFVKEAHDVFNSSLLGCKNSKRHGNQVMEKLNLWTNNTDGTTTFTSHTKNKDKVTASLESDFTYYLYNPTDKKVHKAKLEGDIKPAYRIFISRNIELVRDLRTLKGKGKEDDDIPMLIALVQEDSGVTFLLPDLTPIHSLF